MAQECILQKVDGVVHMEKTFDYMCSQLRNGRYRVRIERYTEPRTLPQNALMWMWMKCIEDETGTPAMEVYDHYCKKFLSYVNRWGEQVNTTSSKLDTRQMTEFLRKIQADAAAELGITLPLPEDRYYREFVGEYRGRI